VEKVAEVSRTSSEMPWTSMNHPPSADLVAFSTNHSSSRTTTTVPGAGTVSYVTAVTRRP